MAKLGGVKLYPLGTNFQGWRLQTVAILHTCAKCGRDIRPRHAAWYHRRFKLYKHQMCGDVYRGIDVNKFLPPDPLTAQ